MSDTAVRLDHVTHDYGTVRALDDLSFEVPPGIVFGFLGPNGSGKTTTIRLLLGLLAPARGRAEVLGFDQRTQGQQIREQVGALLEHHGLYERMSAADNLGYYARIWGLSPADREARIKELLTHAGLYDRRGEIVETWSRGMKQKLAIARVLLHRPAVIFLDEPTAGLDPVAAVELRDDLAQLATREGATVFLTTHNLAEAEKLCAQVAVISKGKLLACGAPDALRQGGAKAEVVGVGFTPAVLETLRQRPEVAAVTLEGERLSIDLTGEVSLAPLVALLVQAGAQVEEVQRVRASLEESFLALMEGEQ